MKSYPIGAADNMILLENVIKREHNVYIKQATRAWAEATFIVREKKQH